MVETLLGVIESLVGSRPSSWVEVTNGYTRAQRWVVGFEDEPSAFVKHAVGNEAEPIRRETAVLEALDGDFHPRLIGAHADDERALIVVEDLSDWSWPPPYPSSTDAILEMLDQVAAHPVPPGLDPLARPAEPTWPGIVADPTGLLSLEVCSPEWLAAAADHLIEAEERFDPTGDDLVHNDIWAGNIAVSAERSVLVDWAEAKRGSRTVDSGFLHLSLRSEGALAWTPRFRGDVEFVAWWTGRLATSLTDGIDPRFDPSMADGLLQDLHAAVAWAAELFGIPS